MKRFEDDQRVLVANPDEDRLSIKGRTGVVTRKLHRDESAWIRLDTDLPDNLRVFPADDPHGRGNHINLWPDECEPVAARKA